MIAAIWFALVVSNPLTHEARTDYVFSDKKDCAAAAARIMEQTPLKAKCKPVGYTPTKAAL